MPPAPDILPKISQETSQETPRSPAAAYIARWAAELKSFDWADLQDPDSIGLWPGSVKALVLAGVFAAAMTAAHLLHLQGLDRELQQMQSVESGLRAESARQSGAAAALEDSRAQSAAVKRAFIRLLHRLPAEGELPELIDDITATGEGSGLEFTRITPAAPTPRAFYTELPIHISAVGAYHDFGTFVGAVAGLDRIVTLHDFSLSQRQDGRLDIAVTARTYHYRTDGEGFDESGLSIDDGAALNISGDLALSIEGDAVDIDGDDLLATDTAAILGPLGLAPPPEAVTYRAAARRSPFAGPSSAKDAAHGPPPGDVAPDLSRARGPLENQPLGELAVVGWLHRNGAYQALVQDRAGGVHRVQAGDYLGPNHGRVIAVSATEISLREIVRSGGGWIERPQILTVRALSQ